MTKCVMCCSVIREESPKPKVCKACYEIENPFTCGECGERVPELKGMMCTSCWNKEGRIITEFSKAMEELTAKKQHRRDKALDEAIHDDGGTYSECAICGLLSFLEGHHIQYPEEGKEMKVYLCVRCHRKQPGRESTPIERIWALLKTGKRYD